MRAYVEATAEASGLELTPSDTDTVVTMTGPLRAAGNRLQLRVAFDTSLPPLVLVPDHLPHRNIP